MPDYSGDIDFAQELIAEFGGRWRFVVNEAAETEMGKDWRVTSSTNVSYYADAVAFANAGPNRTIYIAAEGLEVELNDDMTLVDPNGDFWGFDQGTLQPLMPAHDRQIIIYEAFIITRAKVDLP